MYQHSPHRQPYPSDLSDAQWRNMEPLIPPERDRGRHRSTNVREVINGINYRWSTGCVWRMLPHDFPPWATVYTYFRRWQREGTLKELREGLVSRPRRPRENGSGETRGRGCSDSRRQEETAGIFAGDPVSDRAPVSDQHPVPTL